MFKEPVQFPQPNKRVMAAGGIKGMHDTLSPAARPLGVLTNAINLRRWGPTAAATRLGRTQFATPLPPQDDKLEPLTGEVRPPRITGMASYYFGPGGTASLIVGYGETIYYQTAVGSDIVFSPMTATRPVDEEFAFNAPWTSAIFDNPIYGTEMPPLTRADEVLIITNGVDEPMKWNGRTLKLEPIFGNPPKAKYVCVAFGRVFLAHITETVTGVLNQQGMALPNSIYASDEQALEIWPDSSTTADDTWFEHFDSNDGDHITWIQLYQRNVVFWKQHSVWEIHGPGQQGSVNWQTIAVGGPGCVNGRTIVEIDGVLYWLSYEGVVRWSGGRIEVISNPTMNATIANIDWKAAEDSACATHDIEGNYILTVPQKPPIPNMSGEVISLVFNTKDSSWWVWTDWNPEAHVRHRATGASEEVYMASGAEVFMMGGADDAGADIVSEAQFGPSAGDSTFKNKFMRRAYFVLSGESGASVTASASPALTEPPLYQNPVPLDLHSAAAETRHVTGKRCYLPLTSGVGQSISSYAPRMLLSGTGPIVIHDAAVEYSERES